MKIKLKPSALKLLFAFILVFIFTMKGFISLDPDFGWRVKSGQLILSEGIQKFDPFSYTMPSFPWVDHAWPMSVFFFILYSQVGKAGLALATSLVAILGFGLSLLRNEKFSSENVKGERLLVLKSFGKDYWYLGSISFLLSASVILPYSGIRAQVATWAFFAALLHFLLNKERWIKWRFIVPVLFLIWTNVHGGFVSGLSVLFFVILVRSFGKKKLELAEWTIFFVSFLLSFVNPFGIGVWREVWSSVSDSSLRWSISEWMPALTMVDFSMIMFITLSFALIARYKSKFALEELGLYFIFLLQGILSKRHMPLWVIVSTPILARSLGYFYQEMKNDRVALSRLIKVYRYAWVVTLCLFVFQSCMSIIGSKNLSEEVYYPRNAVSFLRKNLPVGEVFSNYNWGGYLIWKLPEKKVFVDGRMPSWRWKNAPEGESGAAFDDFRDLVAGEIDYKLEFENYGVDTVLWPVPKEPSMYDVLQKKLDNLLVKFGKEKNEFDFIEELQKDGWREVYKDNVAVIYSAPI